VRYRRKTGYSGMPELWNGIADVRDVAFAHIKAGLTPGASGRQIIVSGEATLFDIAKILQKYFPENYPFPRRRAPNFLFRIIAPIFGYTRKYASKNLGYHIKFDSSYSKMDLGMSYIPIEQTTKEHFQQILDDDLLSS